VQAHSNGGQKGHGSTEEHCKKVEGNGAEDDRLGADKPQALESLVQTAPGGGYPVLEHVVDLLTAHGDGLDGTDLSRRLIWQPDSQYRYGTGG
jgi:hypothetical protein